jgi:hypothetical protein
MKITDKSISLKSYRCLEKQISLALMLVISPMLIFGYNPPRDQQPPSAPGGGTGFAPVEIGEVLL